MAITIEEIMNRELYSVPPSQSAWRTIRELHALGITSAPVIAGDRLIGIASLSDLVTGDPSETVSKRMHAPITVAATTPIESAARLITEANIHHLAVVDDADRAIGFISSLDLLRGLLGMPAHHPGWFPGIDPHTGIAWSGDTDLDLDRVESAPEQAGVVAFVLGGSGRRENVVWAEASGNLRRRLIDLLTARGRTVPDLDRWRGQGRLRFRTAVVDAKRAAVVVDALQRTTGYARP